MTIAERIRVEADDLRARWQDEERWRGITRPYEAEDVVRLRADGSLDPTFATNGVARVDVAGGTDAAHGIARQPTGKIVAAGETWRKGVPRFLVIRLTA